MTIYYQYLFICESTHQVINIPSFEKKDLVYYNKYLQLKLPEGGKVNLVKVLHKDLAFALRDKIISLKEESPRDKLTLDIDSLYKEVLLTNTTKYFWGKAVVLMESKESHKYQGIMRIYSEGSNYFYKKKDNNEWTEILLSDNPKYKVYVGTVFVVKE